ncbi:TolB-like protein/Tfp pilus assembly protein PilF [Mesorhizobium jarvisii]
MAQYANSVHEGSGATTLPGEDEVRAQLDRIRSSPDFEVPDRARKFLSYIVEETLTGRASRIKAYSIATEVFGRDASFDAQNDPVVRIEASRIRRALERYYLTAGRDDPLGIAMPKGGYVPIFARRVGEQPPKELAPYPAADGAGTSARPKMVRGAWLTIAIALLLAALVVAYRQFPSSITQDGSRSMAPIAGKPELPTLVVRQFEDLTGTNSSAIIARGLTEEVIGQLARFKELQVIADRQQTRAALDTATRLGRFSLEGGVRIEGNRLRVTTHLINRSDGSVVWSNIYDEDLQVRDLLDLEADMAGGVATALAQPSGVIFTADAAVARQSPPDDLQAYECTLAYYSYRANLNQQTHASVQDCLKQATQRYPNYATAWSLLSLTYVDELRFRQQLGPQSETSLDDAAKAAAQAVALEPQNVRGLEAEMLVHFFRGETDTALEIGRRALKINPNDTELSAEYGFRLAVSGKWSEGSQLIANALVRNPGPQGYYEMILAFCEYMQSDYAAADRWIKTAELQEYPNFHYHFVAAAIAGQLGDQKEAARHRQWIEANAAGFLQNIRHEMALRLIRPEDRAHLVEGLLKAGITIPNR